MRDYYLGNIVKHLYRNKEGDLEKAKFYLDKLIEMEAQDDDIVEIDLLDEFEDALLGCVYEPDGNPVPCYDSTAVIDQLTAQGMSGDDAVDYMEKAAEGLKVIWIRDLELQGEPTKPRLRLVH